MVNVYKGKSDAFECALHLGMKLLDHVLNVLKRVIEVRIRNRVNIDGMQFGLSREKGEGIASRLQCLCNLLAILYFIL